MIIVKMYTNQVLSGDKEPNAERSNCQGHTVSKRKMMNKSRKFTPRYHFKTYSPHYLLSMYHGRAECVPSPFNDGQTKVHRIKQLVIIK